MNALAYIHRLNASLFLASAVVALFSSCTNMPATAENSAPIGFCRAVVRPSDSHYLEKLAVARPSRSSPNLGYSAGSDSALGRVGDFQDSHIEQAIQYEPAEGMPDNVKIERLTPADKDRLEAKYRDRPEPRLIIFPPAPPDLLAALNIAGEATVYLIVGTDGNVSDIYLADCTNEHLAQAVALRLSSTHFGPLAQECMIKLQYRAWPLDVKSPRGEIRPMVQESIMPDRGSVTGRPITSSPLSMASVAAPPPTPAEISQSEKEHWKSANLPGLKIFSTASNDDSERMLHDFLLFYRAVGTLWPAQAGNCPPLILIFCAHYPEYAEFDFHSNPQTRAMSWFAAAEPMAIVNLDIQMGDNSMANDASAPTLGNSMTDDSVAHALQGFFARAFLGHMGGRMPPWLNQGLGRALRGMVCTEDAICFPALTTDVTLKVREAGSEDDLQAALKDGTFLPFDQLFSGTAHPHTVGSPVIVPPGGARYAWLNLEPTGTWEDECYEFVYLCLFGAGGKYRQPFFKFVQLTSANPPDEAMFESAFGVDYHTMLLELWRYTAVGT
ncbi:MAG TPA: hypothetical protein VMI53_05355, partial [Opitutaceae bacterium]|nr:hypothetical protein [Opitutaceae bacterium]